MSILAVFNEARPDRADVLKDPEEIAARLETLGALFERWETGCEFGSGAEQAEVLAAYKPSVERLQKRYGFQSADVIGVTPEHPQKAELRAKFLSEHTHSDFEVRFFVEGRGLFYLHPDENVYALLCQQGDLLSVPAGMKHWFDMGERPQLKCIRLFTTPDGWVADFTGDKIADAFPKLEGFVEAYA